MKALQSYQTYLSEIKSKQRDEAAAAYEEYRTIKLLTVFEHLNIHLYKLVPLPNTRCFKSST